VEEQKNTPGEKPPKKAPGQAAWQPGADAGRTTGQGWRGAARDRRLEPNAPFGHWRSRNEIYFGMAVSNLVAYFIIMLDGPLLHTHGITHIETATQAAEALWPVGGRGRHHRHCLLAVPVLAGSAGYAPAEIAAGRSPSNSKFSFFSTRQR
jgi:hypothetical protein